MLTHRQREVYNFIAAHQKRCGYAPTYAEIMAGCGLASNSNAHRLIQALAERGFVRRLPHRARGLEIVDQPPGPGAIAIPATVCRDCGDQLVGVPCPRDHARAA